MKQYISSIIFSIAIVISSIFLGKAYVDRSKTPGEIRVTGLGQTDFSSDLIVWEGEFTADDFQLTEAFKKLKHYRSIVDKYLRNKGIKKEEIIYSAVSTIRKTSPVYSGNGNYVGEEFAGYRLTQQVQIKSKDVDKVEKISREITEILNQGIPFYSQAPRYYYTKLADLKIEMISKASKDARLRAEKIVEHSGAQLGKLKSAKMGIFQITGQYSEEDYSWGGTFNTSSREKTASITVKLVYQIK